MYCVYIVSTINKGIRKVLLVLQWMNLHITAARAVKYAVRGVGGIEK